MDSIVDQFKGIHLQLLPQTNSTENSGFMMDTAGEQEIFPDSFGAGEPAAVASTRPRRACRENAASLTQKLNAKRVNGMKKKSFKPDGADSKLTDFTKIYTAQTLRKFRPANLETVFEASDEDAEDTAAAASAMLFPAPVPADMPPYEELRRQVSLVGAKKLRRSITCKTGTDTTKTLVKRRRDKIRRNQLPRHRKISMDTFVSRMQRLDEEANNSDNDENDGDGGGDASMPSETDMIVDNLYANLQKFAAAKPPT